MLRGLPLVLVGLSVWLLLGGRMRRATQLDDSADLSRLLKGVLQQPGAFGHVAALFHRPLVPLCGGASISPAPRARAGGARSAVPHADPQRTWPSERSAAAQRCSTTTPARAAPSPTLGAVDIPIAGAPCLERAQAGE
ncbi:MAG: hypothetical protein U0168_00105 [Nannocystaceae bacterium]